MIKNKRNRISNEVMFIITLIFVIALALVLLFRVIYPKLTLALESSARIEETRECIQWQKWSKEIRKDLFYLTPWQKEQCDAVGIKIDAPVKGKKED